MVPCPTRGSRDIHNESIDYIKLGMPDIVVPCKTTQQLIIEMRHLCPASTWPFPQAKPGRFYCSSDLLFLPSLSSSSKCTLTSSSVSDTPAVTWP